MNHKLAALWLLLYLFITVNAIADPKQNFEKHFKLLPQPQKVELVAGKGIAYNTLRSVYLKGLAVKPVLYGELKSLPYATNAGAGVLVLNLTADKNHSGSSEGYSIEIKKTRLLSTLRLSQGCFMDVQLYGNCCRMRMRNK